tara:strand:- start:117 stop:374 length:258 start_codon:yes stop_codon:yes gene_type:complete
MNQNDFKKNVRRTPSNSRFIQILLFKKTMDSDLYSGLQVCYKDLSGAYTKLGIITDIYEKDGFKHYLLNTAMGAYLADELKLIKE